MLNWSQKDWNRFAWFAVVGYCGTILGMVLAAIWLLWWLASHLQWVH